MQNLKVGDVLWFQPSKLHTGKTDGYEVHVTKVGRIWVELERVGCKIDEGRVQIGSLNVESKDKHHRGMLYASKMDRDFEVERQKRWEYVRKRVPYGCPANLTLDQIETIGTLIGLDPADIRK